MSQLVGYKWIFYGFIFVSLSNFYIDNLPLSYIATGLLLVVNIICLNRFVVQRKKSNRTLSFSILLFCLINIISWAFSPKTVVSDSYGNVSTSFMMTATVVNLTSFYTVYILTERKILVLSKIEVFFFWMFLISIVSYIFTYRTLDFTSSQGTANNDGYLILFLFLVLALKGLDKRTLLFLVVFFLVLFSAKRGALLCLGLTTILFIYFKYLKGRQRSLIVKCFLLIVIIGILATTTYLVYQGNSNLQTKVTAAEEGNSSGRDYMYETCYAAWEKADIKEQIFGLQYAGAFKVIGVTAHNDWLDLLISCGVVGVISYAFLFIALIIRYIKIKEVLSNTERFCFLTAVLVWLLKCFFSQAYFSREIIYSIIIIGYILAQAEENYAILKNR